MSPNPSLPAFWHPDDLSIDDFASICDRSPTLDAFPMADRIEKKVVIYQGDTLRAALADPHTEHQLRSELNVLLREGPGVFVVRNGYPDMSVLDRATDLFKQIIREEQAGKNGRGDHFGNNERIWNAIQKTCLRDPANFIDYYGNPILALAARAWLGPSYQITAQVNNVKPDNQAQSPHRDYHLGFQAPEVIAQYPAHIQVASQYLTLQGAIAHTDMPLESGPTLFLPYSQCYPAGYLAYREPPFVAYFDQAHVQLPLSKGDAVFFSPALFHGAGANHAASDRLANLVQISSAFGRPMESINRDGMIEAVYPVLLERLRNEAMTDRHLADTIAALADGYAFPTNLDADPPLNGHAPQHAQKLLQNALKETWPPVKVRASLEAYAARRKA